MYRSLARWCFRRGALVLVLWIAALIGVNALAATFTAAYASADSDINFYDSQSTRFSTGLLYNF